MGIKNICVCDCCGKELTKTSDTFHLDFKTNTFLDAAGSRDYNFERIDLCESCVKRAVTSLETIAKSIQENTNSGEWELKTSEFYDDDGEFITYAIAHCPICKKPFHNNETISSARSTFYMENDENTPIPDNVKNEVRQELKERLKKRIMPNYCEWCGSKLSALWGSDNT